MKAFRAQWQSPEVQSIFEYTKRSFKENPDLSAGAKVPRYGWAKAGRVQTGVRQSRMDKEEGVQMVKRGDVENAVLEFRKKYPALKVETEHEEEGKMDVEGATADEFFPVDIGISFIALGMRLRFQVRVEQDANAQPKITAECVGETQPYTSISKSLASRPRPNDLKHLLVKSILSEFVV